MSQFVARLHVVDTFRVCCRFAAPVVDVAGDRRPLLFFGVAVEQEGQIVIIVWNNGTFVPEQLRACLLLGYPNVKFLRTPPRKAAQVRWM